MWAPRYFAVTYWTPQYWPPGGVSVVTPPVQSVFRPRSVLTVPVVEFVIAQASFVQAPASWQAEMNVTIPSRPVDEVEELLLMGIL